MAMTEKRRGRWWSRFHFGVRFLGLTGLLLLGLGLAVSLVEAVLTWDAIRLNWRLLQEGAEKVSAGEGVPTWPHWGLLLLGIGLVAGLFALLVEILIVTRMVAGRRSALGFNALAQVVLATILLIGVNLWSAGCDIDMSWLDMKPLHSEPHFARIDATRDQVFTLPPQLIDDLRQLQGETTIIVYDRNRPFGKSPDKQDAKDQAIQNAAERVVVEKLMDLVEQFREEGVRFRESGARFQVEVLEVEDENIDQRLKTLTETLAKKMVGPEGDATAKAAELRQTIEGVPENSIFIVSGNRMQRLSFNDFYYLDKQGSRQADNLVLLNQGVEPLTRKIMNVDEKKPVVGVLVVHELLTTESKIAMYSMAPVRKALEGRGFVVRDIILKKNWDGMGEPEPAVLTFDESRYEQLDDQLNRLNEDIRDLERVTTTLGKLLKQWQDSTLAELTEAYKDQLQGRQVTDVMRKNQLRILEQNLAIQQFSLTESKQERDNIAKQMSGLSVDRLAEQRRISDVKYKLDRELAECDLVIVPRISLININRSWAIPYEVHLLQEAQVSAIKDYLKQGKPALFCLGPASESGGQSRRSSDGIDDLLAQLGFVLNKQTVVFDKERKSFTEVGGGLVVLEEEAEIPPLEFNWPAGSLQVASTLDVPLEQAANPVRQAMRIAASGLSQHEPNLLARHPRPIGFDPAKQKQLPFDPVFLVTSASSWSENNPFPGRGGVPRLDPTDPDKAPLGNAERRGPFAVGMAVEEAVPRGWYGSENAKPATVRVAVIGQGHVFIEDDAAQAPVKETLLLTLTNWLLGRDDLLPSDASPWSYPRVSGQAFGENYVDARILLLMPFFFIYIGAVVFLMRRVR